MSRSVVLTQAPQHEAQSPPSIKHWSTPATRPSSSLVDLEYSQLAISIPDFVVPSVAVIKHVSPPSPPYDVGEMRSESRPHALSASRVSTSFPRQGEHFRSRALQTLISHLDVLSIVALNHDSVIANTSLRRRGDEIRATTERSRRVPSIDFLCAAGRALPPHLPDTGFARRWQLHCCP